MSKEKEEEKGFSSELVPIIKSLIQNKSTFVEINLCEKNTKVFKKIFAVNNVPIMKLFWISKTKVFLVVNSKSKLSQGTKKVWVPKLV